MIDYYELLGLNEYRNKTEEELVKFLDNELDKLDKLDEKSKNKSMHSEMAFELYYGCYYGFKKSLENYGSKVNYDRALQRSVKLFKIMAVDKAKIKKIALGFIIAGSITGAVIAGYSLTHEQITIPSYELSIAEICNKYDIKPYELRNGALAKKIFNEDKVLEEGVTVSVTNEKADEINEKIRQEGGGTEEPIIEPGVVYSFQYRVTNVGVTPYWLRDHHGALLGSFSYEKDGKQYRYNYDEPLPFNSVFTIYTYDKKEADEMQRVFDEEKYEEPVSFITYNAEPGDRLPDIASEYNSDVNAIMGYNSDIYGPKDYDINYVPLDRSLIIPVYEKVKTR